MVTAKHKRAKIYEDIKPLIDMCNAGKLFDVQAWIAAGKPINLPSSPEQRARKKHPLQIAIDKGFHSLVQVLLEGGAEIDYNSYDNALMRALSKRRLDLIQLLVQHGADVRSIDMASVFESWDPAIMEYFIEHGADVETGNPLAFALCYKIRTVLGVFKRHKDRYPSFQEQVNIALRHHCREGNLKWVSLLLWAGGDPFAKGSDSPDRDPDPDEDLCALEYAALYGHFDIFKLKQVRLDPNHSISEELMRWACRADTADFLKELIKNGFKPDSYENSGSSLIQACISNMGWTFDFYSSWQRKDIDNPESREKIKMIYLLAENGAKWMPGDRYEVNDVRRSLLKMKSDYTVEFIWIMSKFHASTRKNIDQLIRTPTMRALLSAHQTRVKELVEFFPKSQEIEL
jgi:ankyrin repeat protein